MIVVFLYLYTRQQNSIAHREKKRGKTQRNHADKW
jgi:hypothetical protein